MRRKPARAWKSSRLGASSWKLSIKVEAGRLAKGAAMAMKIRWSRPDGRHPLRTLLLRIALELREAGYSADGASQLSQLGTYSEGVGAITVRPGPQSYHAQDGAVIH